LWPHDQNVLLPLTVALDSTNRRAYAYALRSGTIAEIDIDRGEFQNTIDSGTPGGARQLIVGPPGTLWVAHDLPSPQALVRILPATGQVTDVTTGLQAATGVIVLPGDRFAVMGTLEDGAFVLQVLSRELELLETL